jgi:hypothetical protein
VPEGGLVALAVLEDLDELEEVEAGVVAGLEPDAAADPGDLSLEGRPERFHGGVESQQSPVEPKPTCRPARWAIEQNSPDM